MKVNGDIFTKTELEQRQIAALRARMGSGRSEDRHRQQRRRAEEGARRGHAADPGRCDRRAAARAARQGARLSPERRAVQERGRQHPQGTEARGRREVPGGAEAGRHDDGRPAQEPREADARQQVQQRRGRLASSAITEDEARQYYDAHRTSSPTPATVTLREILVDVPTTARAAATSTSAQDDEARRQAEAIRARATGGEDFAKLAAEVSDVAVEGQRRPDRADQRRRSLAGAAEADREDEAGRRHASRCARRAAIRSSSSKRSKPAATQPFEQVRDLIADKCSPTSAAGRGAQVPREAARPGDHRVEERRGEEGCTRSRLARRRRGAGSRRS